MARKQNGLVMENTIEPILNAPLDARQQVKLKADLTDPASYPYHYIGMVVGCREDNRLYVLVGKDTTLEENWKKLVYSDDDLGGDTIDLSEYAKLTDIAQIQADLANYCLKKDVYTKEEVDDIVAAINSLEIVTVPTLPTSNIRTDCIYLVKDSLVENNLYSEYIYLGEGDDKGWEKFGSASIDVSNLVTNESLTTTLANYPTKEEMETAIEEATSGSLDDAVEITAAEVAALFA